MSPCRLQDQGSTSPTRQRSRGLAGEEGCDRHLWSLQPLRTGIPQPRAPLSPRGSHPTSAPSGCGTNPIYGQSLSHLGTAPGLHGHFLPAPHAPRNGEPNPSEGTDPNHRESRAQPSQAAAMGERELSGDKSKEKGKLQRAGTGCGGGSPAGPGSSPRDMEKPPKGSGDGAPQTLTLPGGLGTAPCAVGTPRGSHGRGAAGSALPPGKESK